MNYFNLCLKARRLLKFGIDEESINEAERMIKELAETLERLDSAYGSMKEAAELSHHGILMDYANNCIKCDSIRFLQDQAKRILEGGV